MSINAGKFRNKILIESASQAADASGALVDTYSTFATWWAAIEQISGREYVAFGKVASEGMFKMRGRFISGVLPAMRLKFGTRIYSIIAPPTNIDERGHEMTLICKEVI